MKFLLLNQFVPPDPAPTARLLGDLAAELRRRGHETVLVGDAVDYRGRKTRWGSRLLREGLSLGRLFWRACRVPGRVDAVLSLTSPPMLPVVARWTRLRHRRARLLHWAMDLYPDVAVALGEVRTGSPLHRITEGLMASCYRACDLVVVLDEDMAGAVRRRGVDCEVLPPWPPEVAPSGDRVPDAADGGSGVRQMPPAPRARDGEGGKDGFTWLYSGNLGRAHDWHTLLEAQGRLEAAGVGATLCFQGGGVEREPARRSAEAMGLHRCRWIPYAPEAELLASLQAADCLVATQRPETMGCLWPSKLALTMLLERPLVWVGAPGSAVTRRLRAAGHACFAPGESEALAETVAAMVARQEPISLLSREEVAARVERLRSDGVAALANWAEGASKGEGSDARGDGVGS